MALNQVVHRSHRDGSRGTRRNCGRGEDEKKRTSHKSVLSQPNVFNSSSSPFFPLSSSVASCVSSSLSVRRNFWQWWICPRKGNGGRAKTVPPLSLPHALLSQVVDSWESVVGNFSIYVRTTTTCPPRSTALQLSSWP